MANYEERRGGMGAFGAALIGAVIGAVGSAVVILMSSKENRQKTKEKFEELKEMGTKAFNDIEKRGREMIQQVKAEVSDIKEETEASATKSKKRK